MAVRDAVAGDDAARVNGSGPQPKLEETPVEVSAQEAPAEADAEKPARKPRTARRPRRAAASEEKSGASETAAELPAFISGSAE